MSCSIPLVPAAHNSRAGPDEGISCVPVSSQWTTQRRSPASGQCSGTLQARSRWLIRCPQITVRSPTWRPWPVRPSTPPPRAVVNRLLRTGRGQRLLHLPRTHSFPSQALPTDPSARSPFRAALTPASTVRRARDPRAAQGPPDKSQVTPAKRGMCRRNAGVSPRSDPVTSG
jgi:hypothetical protein